MAQVIAVAASESISAGRQVHGHDTVRAARTSDQPADWWGRRSSFQFQALRYLLLGYVPSTAALRHEADGQAAAAGSEILEDEFHHSERLRRDGVGPFEGSLGGNLSEQAVGADLAKIDRNTGFQCRSRLVVMPSP